MKKITADSQKTEKKDDINKKIVNIKYSEESKPHKIVDIPKKNMNISIKEGASFSVMDGFTANFITPFAIALNAGNTFISFLVTLPSLIAAFLQLSVEWLLKLNNKRKFWIMLGVFLQALMWIPLALMHYVIPQEYNHIKLYLVFTIITLSAIFSAIISPLWTSMMGDIVQSHKRGEYFGKRNSIIGSVTFIATFIAGFTLNYLSPRIGVIPSFSIIFVIACIARLVSFYFFTKMTEPVLEIKKIEKSNIVHFIKKIRKDQYGIFVMYLCALGFAVNLASPFFSVYMLKELNFTYTKFTLIVSASIIASFLTMKLWGKISDRYGSKNVLILTGILISFVPLLWIFTTKFYVFFIIEIFSGLVWAGFNLSSSNYIYDATDPENRTKNVAYLNILKGILVFFGAISGGFIINHFPSLGFKSTILLAFLISFLMRLLVSLYFFNRIKEARLIELRMSKSLFLGLIMVNPRQAAFTYNHPRKIESKSNQVNKKIEEPKKTEKPKIVHRKNHEKIEIIRNNLHQHFRTREVNLKDDELNINNKIKKP